MAAPRSPSEAHSPEEVSAGIRARAEAEGPLLLYSIGINAYDRSPLRGCVRDSNNMVAALRPLGFECHQLLDRDASLENIEDFIAEGVSRVGPRGLLVLHDSGHGGSLPSRTEPDRTDECWFAYDLRPLVDKRVAQLLGKIDPDGQALVVADSCYSQTITRELGRPLQPLGVEDAGDSYRKARLYVPDDPKLAREVGRRRPRARSQRALARAARSAPIVEFSACRDDQVTYDATINGVVQGCFTRAFLDALKDLGVVVDQGEPTADPWPTLNSLYRVIRTKLPSEEYDNVPQRLGGSRLRWLALRADQRR